MIRRAALGGTLIGVLLLCASVGAIAGGFGIGLDVWTLDTLEALDAFRPAVGVAYDRIEAGLLDMGISPSDLQDARDVFDESLLAIEGGLSQLPPVLPLPHPAVQIEISLLVPVLDAIRFSVGALSDEMVRAGAAWIDLAIPSPLVDIEFDVEEEFGSVVADLEFSSLVVSADVVSRFDLLIAALSLHAGLHFAAGAIVPSVEADVPLDLAPAVAEAVNALHLDGMAWSGSGVHAGFGVEIGPPFLRLHARVRMGVEVTRSSGWWELSIAPWAASVGMVIRF